MSHTVSFDEEDVQSPFAAYNGLVPDLGKISLDERQDATTIRKVKDLATPVILAPLMPPPFDPSLIDRISVADPESQNAHLEALSAKLESAQASLQEIADNPAPEGRPLVFPNLAWESIKLGLAKEKLVNDQLNGHIQAAEKHQKEIDLLLDFSAELTAHKKGEGEMSEKMKSLLAELKERGIDLWKSEEMTLNEERVSDLKSLTNAQVDKLRSNLQIIFTTKIQTLIQSIGAIIETLKDIIRNNTKLINAANRLPGHG